MITPIMIALICEALVAAPRSWREGAVALGLNPLRAMLAVTLRAIRPAIVAAAVLATARALGEAVMISMVSGGSFFTPNLSHGAPIFLYEPLRTLASTIIDFSEGIGAPALDSTLYAFAALLLFSAFVLSIARLPDQAASAEVPGAGMSAVHGSTGEAGGPERSRPPPIQAGAGAAPRRGRGAGATGSCCSARGRPGIGLCAIAAAIVIYMGYRGIEYLAPSLLFTRPAISTSQAQTGGILDPLIGTLLLTAIGIALAFPLAVASAIWIAEYGQVGRARQAFARVVESSIEIVAGTPDIVLALFGLAIFQLGILAPLSFRAEGGGVYGRSFIAAGAMMSLIALPPLFVATRDGLRAVPMHMREAAFALGKTRIATIRRVLLPSVRSNIATGVTLGVSRIIGDTAIVVLLLGKTLHIETQGLDAGVEPAARDGLQLDQLCLRQLARRRRRGAAEGVRGGVRAAGVRARPEPARRPHRALPGAVHRDVWRGRGSYERCIRRKLRKLFPQRQKIPVTSSVLSRKLVRWRMCR